MSKACIVNPDYIEPCTEPDTSHETPVCENHSDNTSQKEANMSSNCNLLKDCDKPFDTILKDSFRNERRLNIAVMAMKGILANSDEVYRAEICSKAKETPKAVAEYALALADTLLAECEKGGFK